MRTRSRAPSTPTFSSVALCSACWKYCHVNAQFSSHTAVQYQSKFTRESNNESAQMALLETETSDTAAGNEAASERPGLATVDVETLGPGDLLDIQGMLTGLDPASRCLRFGWACSDTPLKAHAHCAVATASRIFGVVADRQLRGVLEIYRARSGCAKVTLVVDQRWRRRGLGSALLAAAIDWADAAGIAVIRLTFARHNWPMRRLMSKACAKFDIRLDEMSAEIATPRMRRRRHSFKCMTTARLREHTDGAQHHD
jgi:GNAT superfamily N-acetyltransferase